MADNHDNPKTIKMFEMISSTEVGKKMLRAVTYLRTNLIGWQKSMTRDEMDDLVEKLIAHSHRLGVILEVGKLT